MDSDEELDLGLVVTSKPAPSLDAILNESDSEDEFDLGLPVAAPAAAPATKPTPAPAPTPAPVAAPAPVAPQRIQITPTPPARQARQARPQQPQQPQRGAPPQQRQPARPSGGDGAGPQPPRRQRAPVAANTPQAPPRAAQAVPAARTAARPGVRREPQPAAAVIAKPPAGNRPTQPSRQQRAAPPPQPKRGNRATTVGAAPARSPKAARSSKPAAAPSSSKAKEGAVKKPTRPKMEHGKVLRGLVLSKLSTHLKSKSTQREAGLPTCVTVEGLMAIGTSRGIVLVYDIKQNLTKMLGSDEAVVNYGAVTSIAMSTDSTRLLVGHEKGQVMRWDLTTGKVLNSMTDVHAADCAVTKVAFTDDHRCVLSGDAKGAVYMHSFRRVVGVRMADHTCLFTSGKTPVCTFEVLVYGERPPPREMTFVALGYQNKVTLAFVRPELQAVISISRQKGDGNLLPSLSWDFVPVQQGDKLLICPVLALSWGETIRFVQVMVFKDEKVKPHLKALGTYKCRAPIISLAWLNASTIMAIDRQERVRVICVRTRTLIEVVDLSKVQLCFNSKFSQATYGDARLNAYDQSVCVLKGHAYLMGLNSVHLVNLFSWKERLAGLAANSKFVQALRLAQAFYDGSALAVVGLPNTKQREAMVKEEIITLLQAYADVSVASRRSKDERLFFNGVIGLCIEYCRRLECWDLLFEDLYEKFATYKPAQQSFLELLVPLIMDDKITFLNPFVMQAFVEHFQSLGQLRQVEECILHLDVATLDLHEVVKMCFIHRLYDGLIYVYNRGMLDYTTPLRELYRPLRKAVTAAEQKPGRPDNMVSRMSKEEQAVGYKLLLYVSYCLAGRAFPRGDLPDTQARQAKSDVYQAVLQRDKDPTAACKFPLMQTLLQFDTREFLNVLSLAFEEEENADDLSGPVLPRRQVVVDILLAAMSTNSGGPRFSPEQIGCMFTFLARQAARHKGSIVVKKELFDRVPEYLANPEDTSRHEERQQALLELLNARGVASFDVAKLLKLAEQAQFWRVCELVYTARKDYANILRCYLSDKARTIQVFPFIHHTLIDPTVTTSEKNQLRATAIDNVKALVEIDPKATAHLMLMNFAAHLQRIVSSMASRPEQQYRFLGGIFAVSQNAEFAEVAIPPETHEGYLKLMCQYEPRGVYTWLSKSGVEYRIKQCLEICREAKITDATAWLLECNGDIREAFALIQSTFEGRIKALEAAFRDFEASGKAPGDGDDPRAPGLKGLRNTLAVAVQMCRRTCPKLDERGRQELWFPLLDSLVDTQHRLKAELKRDGPEYGEHLNALIKMVVNGMMDHVSSPAILRKIIGESPMAGGRFGDIKELILLMLETYNYEKTLLQTTNRIVENDLYWSIRERIRTARKGVRPRAATCVLCRRRLANREGQTTGPLALFPCRHAYHESCLANASRGNDATCIICQPARKGKRGQRGARRMAARGKRPVMPATDPDARAKAKAADLADLSEFQYKQLRNYTEANRTPARLVILDQLEELEYFKTQAGGLQGIEDSDVQVPLPANAITQREEFQLRTQAPRDPPRARPPRVAGCLAPEPETEVANTGWIWTV